jgi:RNA polymerase-binding transcription factor DksA
MVLKISFSMIPNNSKPQLGDTLKELNTAIEEWDKITNKPDTEQAESPNPADAATEAHMAETKNSLQSRTKELLIELRDQINSLSQD